MSSYSPESFCVQYMASVDKFSFSKISGTDSLNPLCVCCYPHNQPRRSGYCQLFGGHVGKHVLDMCHGGNCQLFGGHVGKHVLDMCHGGICQLFGGHVGKLVQDMCHGGNVYIQ